MLPIPHKRVLPLHGVFLRRVLRRLPGRGTLQDQGGTQLHQLFTDLTMEVLLKNIFSYSFHGHDRTFLPGLDLAGLLHRVLRNGMADDSDSWSRSPRESPSRGAFQARASPVALHADARKRRNLDKEEAARDRLIFRWALLVIAILSLLGLMLFIASRLGEK